MRVTPASLPDVRLIEPDVFHDPRGAFSVTFHTDEFRAAGLPTRFVQHNYSRSEKGVLRGLHYQIEHVQGKLIHVVKGEIFDVAVDIRRSSAQFGKWVGQTLSDARTTLLWVPPGFAHGFYVVGESADIIYYVTHPYSREHERTIVWNDSALNIQWPIPSGSAPILSEKDHRGVALSEADIFD